MKILQNFTLFTILLLICITSAHADLYDDYGNIDRLWDGQKSITNKEFEDVIDALQEKKKKKEEKQKNKKIKKISGGGNSLHSENSYENEVREVQELKAEDGSIVSLPVKIIAGNKTLEQGFYKIVVKKENDGKIYMNFYQSQFLKGKLEAIETDDDYDKETLNFVEILPYNESFLLCIYGSLKFNAYTYLQIAK